MNTAEDPTRALCLYQSDFMLRDYSFRYDELPFDEQGLLLYRLGAGPRTIALCNYACGCGVGMLRNLLFIAASLVQCWRFAAPGRGEHASVVLGRGERSHGQLISKAPVVSTLTTTRNGASEPVLRG